MKKTIPIFIFCGICILLCSGCGFNLQQAVLNNLAEARYNLYHGSNNNADVSFYSGLREEPYVMNWVAGKLVPYAVIKVVPKNRNFMGLDQMQSTIEIDGQKYDILLERNPFEYSFAGDLEKLFESPHSVGFIAESISGINKVELKSVFNQEGDINWEQALKIGLTQLGGEKFLKNKKMQCEIYVKIICDESIKGSHHFWYVSIVTKEGKATFCLIDKSGNITISK
ncbi:MAG: hypothetical protein FWD32_00400 [Firmicutes bacterium]|nr:hypothetical protein [Bacillota bacterium]